MGNRPIGFLIALLVLPLTGSAQWLNYPAPRTPRGRNGKANLSAPAPRSHGKPDLSGIWEAESTPRNELAVMFPPGIGLLPGGVNGLGEDDPQKYFLNILADFKPGQEPLTAAAAAKLQQMLQNPPKPVTLCRPAGGPVNELIPAPYKIVQTPGVTLILYETDSVFRQIYTDGRKHPVDPQPAWSGYSIAKWEGDDLVVDARGFNDLSAFDAMGHFHSDRLHVTQRFHRRDFGHMEIEMTFEDPAVFTRPVTIKSKQVLMPDSDVMESFCAESEHDLEHMRNIKPGN
ncbi:MAG TPA: hypothetical protein VHZ74_27145 [Bryobacteraceae bacterium]|jgi:hypothetical protein|nr:hypothetical protein [Bryobacteraceae bacterium]